MMHVVLLRDSRRGSSKRISKGKGNQRLKFPILFNYDQPIEIVFSDVSFILLLWDVMERLLSVDPVDLCVL